MAMRQFNVLSSMLLLLLVSLFLAAFGRDGANSTAQAATPTPPSAALPVSPGDSPDSDGGSALSGEIAAGLSWPLGAESVLMLDAALTWQAKHGAAQLKCSAGQNGLAQMGYAVNERIGEIQYTLWGGKWNEKNWGDSIGLVRLSGSGKRQTRLRLAVGKWGLDLGAGHAAVRWESQPSLSTASSGWGVTALWGLPLSQTAADGNDDECHNGVDGDAEMSCGEDDWTMDEDVPAADDLSDTQAYQLLPADPLRFNRAVAYLNRRAGGWKWQVAVAGADGAQSHSSPSAYAVAAEYKARQWRVEGMSKIESAGFAAVDAPHTVAAQGVVAGSIGSFAAEVKGIWNWEDGLPATTVWRLTIGGRRGISAGSIVTLYTESRLQRIKSPAWRAQAEVKTTAASSGGATCGSAECPWILPGAGIVNWRLGIEGATPFLHGAVIARLLIGESRSGRMNWWHVNSTGDRVLSALSDSSLVLAAQSLHTVNEHSSLRFAALYAEDVQFKPAPGEGTKAAFWMLQGKLCRAVSAQVAVEYSLSWQGGHEYDGVRKSAWTPAMRACMQL